MITCPYCKASWHDKARSDGGKARWKNTTPESRSQIARKASLARWAKRGGVK